MLSFLMPGEALPTTHEEKGFFSGRRLLIATKHDKEKAIAAVLESKLGVQCVVSDGLDTDLLGTFSGEIERTDDPLTTARSKCRMGMELAGCDLAVASEGSFGPHPAYFFIPADEEILVLIDSKNGLEVIASELSTSTNFNSATLSTKEELLQFAESAGFPAHGLILRSDEQSGEIHKGIIDKDALIRIFEKMISCYGKVVVETDMRASFNPTRMEVIRLAAVRLAEKLVSCCPECSWPGFSLTETVKGLPCKDCGTPTRSPLARISKCSRCGYAQEKRFPNGSSVEDPMYCDRCNP